MPEYVHAMHPAEKLVRDARRKNYNGHSSSVVFL